MEKRECVSRGQKEAKEDDKLGGARLLDWHTDVAWMQCRCKARWLHPRDSHQRSTSNVLVPRLFDYTHSVWVIGVKHCNTQSGSGLLGLSSGSGSGSGSGASSNLASKGSASFLGSSDGPGSCSLDFSCVIRDNPAKWLNTDSETWLLESSSC